MKKSFELWSQLSLVFVRAIIAIVSLSIISDLYLGTPYIHASSSDVKLECKPLGLSDDDYTTYSFPTTNDDYKLEKVVRDQYHGDDDISFYKEDLSESWKSGCELARDGRRTWLIIVLILSSTLFLALRPRRPFPYSCLPGLFVGILPRPVKQFLFPPQLYPRFYSSENDPQSDPPKDSKSDALEGSPEPSQNLPAALEEDSKG